MLDENIIVKHMRYILAVEKKNIIGDRVQKARKALNPPVTQLDLVARLQVLGMRVDQSALSKIESGLRPVLDYEVVALAEALRVSVQWLLKGTEDR